MKTRALAALMTIALIASCGEDDTQGPGGGGGGGGGTDPCVGGPQAPGGVTTRPAGFSYHLVNAIPGVGFESIVGIESAGDGSGRLFVVEQRGRIVVVDSSSATTTSTDFLDISSRVACCGEQGLLGLAFHPDYATNGYFYVYYSLDTLVSRTRLSRFRVSSDPDKAEPSSEEVMLDIAQPFANHNGGGLAFGEGTELYIGVGDGGSGGDPQGNAQNPRTLLGKILRIDVGMNPGSPPYYGIPVDNPFAGNGDGFAEEIFATGMRNPWRISYDATESRLWAGDVGQGLWEEVDIVEAGRNYGWNCREGAHDYLSPGAPPCTLDVSCYTNPVWEYSHSGARRSITGGHVYRGPNVPSLTGRYVYADYSSGEIWALDWDGVTAGNVAIVDAPFPVSSFGVGEDGELYVARYSGVAASSMGIYRLVETPTAP